MIAPERREINRICWGTTWWKWGGYVECDTFRHRISIGWGARSEKVHYFWGSTLKFIKSFWWETKWRQDSPMKLECPKLLIMIQIIILKTDFPKSVVFIGILLKFSFKH